MLLLINTLLAALDTCVLLMAVSANSDNKSGEGKIGYYHICHISQQQWRATDFIINDVIKSKRSNCYCGRLLFSGRYYYSPTVRASFNYLFQQRVLADSLSNLILANKTFLPAFFRNERFLRPSGQISFQMLTHGNVGNCNTLQCCIRNHVEKFPFTYVPILKFRFILINSHEAFLHLRLKRINCGLLLINVPTTPIQFVRHKCSLRANKRDMWPN